MAGRQGHVGQVGHVPGRHDHAAAVGIGFEGAYDLGDLVHRASGGAQPGAPLFAIDRAEVAVGVGPFVPDADAVFVQVCDVRIALQEPQQFVDDAFEVYFFGGHERKAVLQVKTHLIAEHADCARAGAVALLGAVFEDVAVELRGVQRHAVHDHRPGHVGRLAPQLAVDEVADSAGADADRRQRRGEVEHVGDALAAAAGEHRERDEHARESAVEGHAALPDAQQAERVIEDAFGAVEQDPAESPAEDHADRAVEDQVVDLGRRPRGPRLRGAAARQPPRGQEAHEVHEPVPADLQRPERQGDGIGLRIDEHEARILGKLLRECWGG
jgi:hypothetical protein